MSTIEEVETLHPTALVRTKNIPNSPYLCGIVLWAMSTRPISVVLVKKSVAVAFPRNYVCLSSSYSRQAELRMMLQKFARLNSGSRSARTSSFTVPKVVSGLWQKPSWKA
jgi:hypothetical protein